MAVSLQLGLKQTQKLVMTQSLRQAIELLQLSSLELSERISQEMLENPVIEEGNGDKQSENNSDVELLSSLNQNLSGEESEFNKTEEQLLNYGETYDKSTDYTLDKDRNNNYLESVVAHKESLVEHLLWQARLSAKDSTELDIFESIITSLDENGFVTVPIADIASENTVSEEFVQGIVTSIQLFDPIGCAVKDIRESLIIQAKHYFPYDFTLHKLLTDYFVELEKLQYEQIARGLNISITDVVDKSKLIQGLEPFPGLQFSTKEIRYIIPDVEVKYVDNEIIVNLNDDWIPEIRINSYYLNVLKQKKVEKKLKSYIQEKVQSASYLLKNISSRRNTIVKVVKAIMEHQLDFLTKGPGNLKPLTHVDIAQKVNMHESTISRVTTSKFVQTSWGVFELKYFFVSRLKSQNSDDHSSDQIMNLIKNIIEFENKEKPFSDEEIVNLLAKNNINVARRTVSKYRNILHIPSSNNRKKINMIKSEESL